ncbi:hypothetical protein [Nocardioides antri]|uniref:hypothetical protein n=1 Tax=Nocardioides antri TaxID=2607659 RepID=UPI00165EFE87|nr:hypothetical protein [Nocardioides antri]
MTVEVEARADALADRKVVTVRRRGSETADGAAIRRWRHRAYAAAVLALAAGAVLLWQGARPDAVPTDTAHAAETRDQVLIAASAAVETLNTLDHRDVPGGIDAWESVTTGGLGDQIEGIGEKEVVALAKAGAVSTARVVEAAVVELDVSAGSAEVLAFTEVTVTPRSGADAIDRHRYVVELQRVDERWLVTALTPMELER